MTDQAYDELSERDDIDEVDYDPEEELTADDVTDVLLYTLDWSVQSLLERIGSTFDINPTFQRRDAWARDRKSRYIESLMLGLPVPQIVLAEDKASKGRFIVLDGKQRLVTMKQFAAPDEKFPPLKLRDMEFLPQLDGRTFEDVKSSILDSEYAENLLAQPIRTIVVRNWGKPAVLYQVFVRLNQGSLPLSPQELRQALFPGEFSLWINMRSAGSEPIHRARRLKGEDFRMRDAEMLLRSIAFQDALESYNGNLRAFLDAACARGNADWDQRRTYYENLAKQCESGIDRTEIVFGAKDSFLRYEEDHYIRRFNIAVFDAISTVLGAPELTDVDVRTIADQFRQGYERLCVERSDFQDALKTSTKTVPSTALRITLLAELVESASGVHLAVLDRARALLATA
jgi:hypothetical protein